MSALHACHATIPAPLRATPAPAAAATGAAATPAATPPAILHAAPDEMVSARAARLRDVVAWALDDATLRDVGVPDAVARARELRAAWRKWFDATPFRFF